jgi:hypothetical protein
MRSSPLESMRNSGNNVDGLNLYDCDDGAISVYQQRRGMRRDTDGLR